MKFFIILLVAVAVTVAEAHNFEKIQCVWAKCSRLKGAEKSIDCSNGQARCILTPKLPPRGDAKTLGHEVVYMSSMKPFRYTASAMSAALKMCKPGMIFDPKLSYRDTSALSPMNQADDLAKESSSTYTVEKFFAAEWASAFTVAIRCDAADADPVPVLKTTLGLQRPSLYDMKGDKCLIVRPALAGLLRQWDLLSVKKTGDAADPANWKPSTDLIGSSDSGDYKMAEFHYKENACMMETKLVQKFDQPFD